MYKIFTLAAVIAVMPLSQNMIPSDKGANNAFNNEAYGFHFNNTVAINPFGPEKKPAETWDQHWMATAQENIRKSEYNFTWDEKLNLYCTPNRKNNFRFFYNADGFSVQPRKTKIPVADLNPAATPGDLKYRTIAGWKVKFNLDKRQIGKGLWRVAANKAEYIAENITVQYINNDEGMRQNFILQKPLQKGNEQALHFKINTRLTVITQNNKLQFYHKKAGQVLNYTDLKVWDAVGRQLKASFKKNKRNNYCIQVNTAGAVYPITIDPLSTAPSSTVESNRADAYLGWAVASAGDLNGDGYSDVIAGAPYYESTPAQTDEGAVFVYYGSANGINTVAAAILESNIANAHLGHILSTAGDVNGDGYADIIVGAETYSNGQTNEGAAYIYQGSAGGIVTTPAIIIESDQASANLGYSAGSAGDINGDGYSDVVVGADRYDNGQADEGAAFVYYGSAAGITLAGYNQLECNQASAYMGRSVAGAGDVNGDGYSDVVVGAFIYSNGQANEGAVFIYHGAAAGLNTAAATTIESNLASAGLGVSVSGAGDVNGDGYSDVILGAWGYANGQSNEGAAYIHYGAAAGVNTVFASRVESNQVSASMGYSVAGAGDINGDGYSDVLVGIRNYDNGQLDEGAAFFYQGSATGINLTPVMLECNQVGAAMGSSVAAAGDVNGDGYSDVIVGAYQYNSGQNDEGAGFVYHGSPAGLSATPNNTPDDANQATANFGTSVACAGDVNGDGYSDVIIGAYLYDDGANSDEGRAFVYHGSATGLSASPNSTPDDANVAGASFGYCVAGAGDVNGDGYEDVIIGAYTMADGANNGEGRAFVYFGSAAGISASPDQVRKDADQSLAFFGWSLAAAGDVNGDGYADVVIGARGYDDDFSDEGAAFVYHGSASGLSVSPNRVLKDADQAIATFGDAVAGAGDVNGDGYSDIVVGAIFYDDAANVNEGRAFVYYGSATGVPAIANGGLLDDADQAGANFGTAVASAGDVNGDGFADVIIGADSYDDGAFGDEGRAFVYYGSATGLSATPNSMLDDANQANALFGRTVSGAGDVNGDGYADVIVGADSYDDGFSDEGKAFVYYGAPSGLSASPDNTPDDADQLTARFGNSVASAGDVNGDGYSDVIVGAVFYDDGAFSNEGRAFVYHGNNTTNKRNNIRLYNTDLTTPLNSSNFVFGNFGAGLFARSFAGRDKGKLVWESRINYNAYSGTPITNSTYYTSQDAAYTDMTISGTELKALVNKIWGGRFTKLRARVKYNAATAITGQVYSPWRSVSSIIDANNLGILPIDFISFNAAWVTKGKTARLDFKTDKESGICCFDIEKSNDGFNFYYIGSLPAKNISGIQSYSFIDANATTKKQCYRIKIKGMAGQVDYSNIQQLSNDKATEILVFPNPTSDVLQLQLNKAYDKMHVQVFNASGQLVKQLTVAASNQTIPVPVQNLVPGNYWLHLQSGGEKQVLQFIKQ